MRLSYRRFLIVSICLALVSPIAFVLMEELGTETVLQVFGGVNSAPVVSQFDRCPITKNRAIEDAKTHMLNSDSTLHLSASHKHLARIEGELGSVPASSLHDLTGKQAWPHCLPISARVCKEGPMHMDMLVRNTSERVASKGANASHSSFMARGSTKEAPLCSSSVLHLLLEDAWSTMRDVGCDALPVFGTLLGAKREHAIINHTTDVDLAYFPDCPIDKLTTALWEHGYWLFARDGIRSWCIGAVRFLV